MPGKVMRGGALFPRSRIAVLAFFARAIVNNARWIWNTRKQPATQIFLRDAGRAACQLLKGEGVRAITSNLSVSRVDDSGDYEGGGSLIELTLAAIEFARMHGLNYIHTPMRNIDHLPDGMAMADWAAQWESMFNLCKDCPIIQGDGSSMDPAPFNWETFTELDLFPLLGVDCRKTLSAETVEMAKANFRPLQAESTSDAITIAVHVRRGEVTPAAFPDRWMESSIPILITGRVAEQLARLGNAVRIIVISHDPDLDISALQCWPTENWAHVASLPSLCAMARADVLIAAISSFSTVAGIVGKGIVIAPSAFRPLDGWITYDHEGTFDETELESRLISRFGDPGS